MNQLFFTQKIENGFALLDEEESRHLLTVLRRKAGDRLRITDGLGFFYEAELTETGKRHALARILTQTPAPPERPARLHLAIAPVKQTERFEWFLEKATEIGVDEITPLLCRRSERDKIRTDRLEKILVSAMKQSLRARLPRLNELTPFKQFAASAKEDLKCIAWCANEPLPHLRTFIAPAQNTVIAIGPEGDFSPDEVALALKHGFAGVSLGEARLRTETAGLLAVSVANLGYL
ncbi:MAG: 16S rRNA (uracil(1498)-N(3))-methyltransferase [Saprospiraceae bacterium]|nr:16S rRNA (uracil(1498)-N(3))-methyltransferase [Saprospiraceae bacterium]